MKDKLINLTVNEQQLRIIQNALELHARLHMGQSYSSELADSLCFQNVEWPEDKEAHEALFRQLMSKRDGAERILQAFFDYISEGNYQKWYKTPDVEAELDMWSVIRHWFWEQRPEDKQGHGVDSYPPMQLGPLPLPTVSFAEIPKKEPVKREKCGNCKHFAPDKLSHTGYCKVKTVDNKGKYLFVAASRRRCKDAYEPYEYEKEDRNG